MMIREHSGVPRVHTVYRRTYPIATEHGKKERQGRLHYISSKNVPWNRCSVVFLVFLFYLLQYQGSLGAFIPILFPYFLQVLPYMTLILTEKNLRLVSFLFCVLQAQNLARIDWQYNKQSQQNGKACCVHMLYSQWVQRCLHSCTWQLLTKEHTHKVYTTWKVRWVLSNRLLVYKFFLVHLACIHYTEVTGRTRRMDWGTGQQMRSHSLFLLGEIHSSSVL